MLTIKTIVVNYIASVIGKLKSSLILASWASPFAFLIDNLFEWTNDNLNYITFVLVAIILDHLIGTYVHLFVKKDFSIKKNIVGLLTKSFLVMAVAILINGMNTIIGENFVSDYLEIVGRLMVFLYPAGSAFINTSLITNGKFPPTSFIKRITQFNKDLNPHAFKQKESEIQ